MKPLRLKAIVTLDLGIMGDVEAEITYDYHPPIKGRYSGPPEDCYPDEPAVFDLISVRTIPFEINTLLWRSIEEDDYVYEQLIEEGEMEIEGMKEEAEERQLQLKMDEESEKS